MKKYEYKIVSWTGEAGLVEVVRNGAVERVTLPMAILNSELITEADIDAGIPYGLQFAEFLTPANDIVSRVEVALHNAGIWTLEDLTKKPNLVVNALQSVYRIETGRIIQAAETYLQQEHDVKPPVAPKTKTNKKEIK
jgi:hypothetical protein